MKRNRILSLVFSLMFVLGALSGCGGESTEGGLSGEQASTVATLPLSTTVMDEMNVDLSFSDENLRKLTENAPDISHLRDDIRNSATNIEKSDSFTQGQTYTGTAYYVSNSGNDNNNGLSPETAWATLDKVKFSSFNRGDAIFFERGSVWYGNICVNTDELTFSAYGEGAKPVISGSDPNALLPESWLVYGKTADGGTVWLYEQAQTDVSHIIYDSGTKSAIRYSPNIRDNIYINEAGETFEPTRDLKENLSFFSESDLSDWDLQQTLADEYHPSKLFFRCDGGNPAEVLPDLQLAYTLMGVANEYCGTVIDNLDIQSFGSLAVSGGMGMCSGITDEYSLTPSLLVQNCEISFCGGNISNYSFTDGIWSPGSSGGGIQLSGNGNRAINNYIHDVDSKVFILAHHGNYDEQGLGYEGIEIRGNLLTNNCCALHLTDYGYSMTGCEDACYFDVEFTDNAVLYTGYGWFRNHNRTINGYPHNHDMCTMDICGISHEKDQIILENNLFYGAELMLIATTSDRGHPDVTGPLELKHVQFVGNTYAQHGYFGRIAEDVYFGTDLEAFVKTVLKDETGTTMLQE